MKIFLLDLWHDLKEKRLWPVAVVLLVGLVAVPVLLAKPADEAAAPAPAANAAGPKPDELKQLAKVKLGEDEAGRRLDAGRVRPEQPVHAAEGRRSRSEDAGSSGAGPGDTAARRHAGSARWRRHRTAGGGTAAAA